MWDSVLTHTVSSNTQHENLNLSLVNFVTNITEFVTNITEFVTNVTEFVTNVTEFVTNVTEFVTNVTEFVTNVTEFVTNVTEFVTNVTEFVTNITFTPLLKSSSLRSGQLLIHPVDLSCTLYFLSNYFSIYLQRSQTCVKHSRGDVMTS